MTKKISILFILFAFILSAGFGCKGVDNTTKEAMKPITLEYWRVYDDQDSFDEIIAKYKAIHPHVTINYKKFRYEEYESALANAMIEDRGPDIFSIHNTWVRKYQNRLAPLPPQIKSVYMVEQGSIKKEVVPQMRTEKTLTTKNVRDFFVDTVSKDVIIDEKIYGLPLSVDTLALFYNRDLLNNAGIVNPPSFWDANFQQNVKKMTKLDAKRKIVQSGVALGGSKNINRFSDVLIALMMQNGSNILENGQVLFNQTPPTLKDSNYNPGAGALTFYTDFANPVKEVYAWNSDLPNSLDLFISGNLAMMFSYSYDIATIKARAPKLNFSIAKFPQIQGNPPVNFANYWIESVSKKSLHQDEAWDFIQFATREEQAQLYLKKTNKPTALRSLISQQKNDENIGVFVDQVLTAKSWYQGKNPQAAETAIGEMIDEANRNYEKLQDILDFSASQVQQTIN